MENTLDLTYKGYIYSIYERQTNDGYIILESDTHYGIFGKSYLYYTREEAYELFIDSLKKNIDTRFSRIHDNMI